MTWSAARRTRRSSRFHLDTRFVGSGKYGRSPGFSGVVYGPAEAGPFPTPFGGRRVAALGDFLDSVASHPFRKVRGKSGAPHGLIRERRTPLAGLAGMFGSVRSTEILRWESSALPGLRC